MTTAITETQVTGLIRNQLPRLLRNDPALRDGILAVARDVFPTKVETKDQFTRMLDELRRDREEQSRKWDEQKAEDRRKWDEQKAEDKRRWDEQNRKWDEQKAEDRRKWDEQNRKWDEQKAEDKRRWDEQNRKWEEQKAEDKRRWDEQNRKWEESSRRWEDLNRRLDESSRSLDRRVTRLENAIGGLGARWGLQSEKAFRDALAAILVESFGVEVVNVNEFDEKGEVFGHPAPIEMDVIIKNGLLIICELKSSMSKSDMYTFERKVRFYERRHRRTANRMIVVSSMIGEPAYRVGKSLGIEMYPDPLDVSA